MNGKVYSTLAVAIVLLAILPATVKAQATGDYRSVADGNWSVRTNWQRFNGGAWVTPNVAQGYPGFSSIPNVEIDNADDITLDVATVTINSLTLTGGGLLSFNGGTLNTSGNPALTINGNLDIESFWSDMTFLGSGALTVTGAVTLGFANSLERGGSGSFTAGSLSIGGFSTTTISTSGNFTVSGTTNIDGTFEDTNNTGVSIFVGNVDNSGTWETTAVTTTANLVFRGGIANSGAFDAGGATFNTNSQTLSGNSDVSFGNNVAITTVRLTNSNSADLVIGGTTTVTGTNAANHGYTDSSVNGTNTFIGNISVGANTSFISTASTNVGSLVFRGGIANAGTFTAGGATFNTNAQAISGTTGLSFANNVAITGSLVTMSNASTLTVTGTTTLTTSGGFTDSNNNGGSITTFVGNVSVGNGTTFTSTAVTSTANLIFRGGIANAGTFNGGAATFNTNNQALTGTSTITFNGVVVVTTVTVTNSNSASVSMTSVNSGVLTGTGVWTQGVNSTLLYSGATITVSAMNASNTGNTVNYNATSGGQTIFPPSSNTYYHLTLSGNGNITKTLAANTIVAGNLSIQNQAIFSVSTFTLSVAGNWTNSSTNGDPFTRGTQTVTFNGTAAQTISNSGDAQGTDFYNVVFNNTFATAPQITTSNAVIVRNALTMTAGRVNLSGTTFTIGTAAGTPGSLTHGGTSASGWMYGGTLLRYINTGAIADGGMAGYMPMGSAADFRPFSISGTVTTGGSLSVVHNNAATTQIVSFADGASTVTRRHDANWVVTRTALVANAAGFTIRGEGTGFGTVGAVADVRLTRVNDVTGIGTAGTNGGSSSTPGPSNPIARRTGVTGPNLSNTFYMASVNSGNTPLPIELIAFNAKLKNDVVELTWSTASELNNDFFTVERAIDLEHFEAIENIRGQGTAQHVNHYRTIDPTPAFGRSYYRLKQTDYDGKFTYSDVELVDYEGPAFSTLKVYPNPTSGKTVTLEFAGLKDQATVPVQMMNTQGQIVYDGVLPVSVPGTLKYEFEFGNPLKQGLYIIKAGQTIRLTQKLIVE